MLSRFGPLEIILIILVLVVFFGGKGKILRTMKELGEGINIFKKSIKKNAK